MNCEEIFKEFPTLETDRLLLRQIDVKKDSTILYKELFSDPEVIKYDGNKVYEIGEEGYSINLSMRRKMEIWQKAYSVQKGIVWGLELKSNRKLIGIRMCEFFSLGIVNAECKLNKKYWNNGLMTEASKAIFDFLEFHDVLQIITTINEDNDRAINLDKKLGFIEVPISEIYLTEDIELGEYIRGRGILDLMQNPDIKIFVKPRIDPRAISLFEKSGDAKEKGDLKESAALNIEALEFQPDFIHSINALAWTKLEMGDTREAIREFDNLLNIKPNKYTGLLGRAYAYSDLQQWSDAINDLKSYLKLCPKDYDTFVMLGNYLFHAKRYRESIAAYDEAIRINPNIQDARQYKQAVMGYL